MILLSDFFEDLQNVRGRSLNTILAYRRDLDLYRSFREHSNGIAGFYDFMKKNHLSLRSQARVISSVRTYLKFCEARGEKCPELRELRPPRIKASLPKALTLNEFQLLLGAAQSPEPHKNLRNRVTLLLLFGLGVRVSELIGLNLRDFQESEKWVKVLGKGNKERLVPLTDELARELKSYIIEARGELLREPSDSILINDRGHRPSRVDIWRWLAQWSKSGGFAEPIGPHRFRHGCATAMLEGGADLRSIQSLLGHSSIQTTQIYTSVSSAHLASALDENHPFSRLERE